MTTTNKTVLGIVIAAVIALIVVFALRAHAPSQTASTASSTDESASLPTAATDTSDTALQQDSAAIDTQLNGLDSDNATVDQGLSEAQQ